MNDLHQIETRSATILDCEAVGDVIAKARGEQWRTVAEAHVLTVNRWLSADRSGVWCRCWIATCDGQVAGVAWGAEGMTSLLVGELSVAPEFRGRGVGTALLLQAELHADSEQIPALISCRVEDRVGMAWLWSAGLSRVRRRCGGELLQFHWMGGAAAVYERSGGIRIVG